MVVSNIFNFSPYLRKIPILTNILQLEKVMEDWKTQKTGQEKNRQLISLNIVDHPNSMFYRSYLFNIAHFFFTGRMLGFICSSIFHHFHCHVSFPFFGGQETLKLMFLNTCCFNRYFWFWDQVVGSI